MTNRSGFFVPPKAGLRNQTCHLRISVYPSIRLRADSIRDPTYEPPWLKLRDLPEAPFEQAPGFFEAQSVAGDAEEY